MLESTPLLPANSLKNASVRYYSPDEETAIIAPGAPTAPPPSGAPPLPPSASTLTNDGDENLAGDRAGVPSSHSKIAEATDDASQTIPQSTKAPTSRKKKRKCATSAKKDDAAEASKKKKKIDGPRKSICHILLDIVRYIAILSSFMMLCMQVIPLVAWRDESTSLQIAVR